MSFPLEQGLQMLCLARKSYLQTPGAKHCQDALLPEFLFTERRTQELPEHSCPWLLMVQVVQRSTCPSTVSYTFALGTELSPESL